MSDSICEEYLHMSKEFPLLSKEEETRLGSILVNAREKAAKGIIAYDKEHGLFSVSEKSGSKEAVSIVTEANDAREILITSNLRLAIKCAMDYKKKYACNLEYDDLVQTANEAMIEAVSYFDPSRGRFSTIAVRKINWALQKAEEKGGRIINLPSNNISLERRINFYISKCTSDYGRYPTIEELSQVTGYKCQTIRDILLCSYVLRLDAPVSNSDDPDESMTLQDTVEDTHSVEEQICSEVADDTLSRDLQMVMHKAGLSERDIEVLRLRYGIEGEVRTLDQIGERFNLTRERIRQIEQKAFRKLRHSSSAVLLASYLYPGLSSSELIHQMTKYNQEDT